MTGKGRDAALSAAAAALVEALDRLSERKKRGEIQGAEFAVDLVLVSTPDGTTWVFDGGLGEVFVPRGVSQ